MRIRLRELLAERGWTAYRLTQASGGEISLSTAYRLLRQDGRVRWLDAQLLETLCRVLNVPVQDVLEPAWKERNFALAASDLAPLSESGRPQSKPSARPAPKKKTARARRGRRGGQGSTGG